MGSNRPLRVMIIVEAGIAPHVHAAGDAFALPERAARIAKPRGMGLPEF
jgi:hypothetical protein